ncbi:MAG TPA: GTA-gp10 family protein [Asticcacaulis sp.]|nr:GTA-gp10 family protein [Asticcacaulis sp.]
MATLGGREARLCVTLGALAALEGHFGVSGFAALAERLKGLGPGDLAFVLGVLLMDEAPVEKASLSEATAAVTAAFAAMTA